MTTTASQETTRPRPGGTGRLDGRTVARVGYGAMQLAERGDRGAPDRDTAVAVLRRAIELGVDHIDTAQFYGHGVANELIRAALHPYPEDLALVSKVGAERTDDGLVAAQRPEQLRTQVEANLRTLDVEQLAVVNLRRTDGGPGIVATGDQVVDLDAQLAELCDLRDEGKVAAIGLSNVSAAQVERAVPLGVACVQNLYNLLERDDEALLETCTAQGISWVPIFPLGSGFPDRPKVADDPRVQDIAASLDATAAQVGLAWLLARAPNMLLIPGTSSVVHLEDNVAAGDVSLDAHDLARLDAAGAQQGP